MKNNEIITAKKIALKLPEILFKLPRIIKGLKIADARSKTKSVGLGLCVENAAKKTPLGLAIRYQERNITYQVLNEWSNKIARTLLHYGLKKGDCVAIMIENRPELLAVVTACAKIGVISAMVNTSQQGKVLTHSLKIVNPKLIVLGEECYDAYETIRDHIHIPSTHHFYLADTDTLNKMGHAPAHWQNLAILMSAQSGKMLPQVRHIYNDDPCFYVYTSGTTGLPKAVIFNHGRFMKAYGSFGHATVSLTKSDAMYVPLPFYHSTAMAICWGSVLAGNATLIMARKFSVSRFWQDIRYYNATAFGYIGELCRYLIERAPNAEDCQHSIKIILGNGLRPSIWREFKQRFNIERIYEFYASSEGNVGFSNVLNFDHTVGFSPYKYALIEYDKENERPIRNYHGFFKKVAKGQSGLLLGEISPKSPFHGYTDQQKTQHCVLRDVFEKGDAWFNTGDLMRDIGFKHTQFVDRIGDTFRWKGENVSTTEVEMLIDEIDNISQSVVYGVSIPNTNGKAGMAQIKLNCDIADFNFSAFYHKLKQALPQYAIPIFISLSKGMEMTGTFKYKKSKLKELGFNIELSDNPIFVLLPNTETYQPLNATLQHDIIQGQYRY
ncbi:long-chain-acyl-CoA synthetase [uncultured Shewanella sp.]|uniref:long-chain-acyl-CoA synthetase n=1 Tax=uncultured Shewanella sp. TaxID=173975 RepID=UPI00261FA24B|nr:long-chain-acyl-CoA synthetase [uncultured Shewanella sp.]